MIIKFNEYIKESLLDKLEGPSEEEMKEYWLSKGFDRTFNTPEEFFDYIAQGLSARIRGNSVTWGRSKKSKFEKIFREDIYNGIFVIKRKYYMILLSVFYNGVRADLEAGVIEILKKYPQWEKYNWVTYGDLP